MENEKSCKPEQQQQLLYQSAELFLAYLSPSDLAFVSSASKSLYRVSKSITARRSSDASRRLEKHPIPFQNTIDKHPYSYFIYTPFSILSRPSDPIPFLQPWGRKPEESPKPISDSFGPISGCGCSCGEDCCEKRDGEEGLEECPCSSLGRRFPGFSSGEEGVMTECGAGCVCGPGCGNRSTQGGVAVKLTIVRDSRKGWGLHSGQFIPSGEFVCEYAGELLMTEEARRRQRKYDELTSHGRFSSALLVVREHLPSGKACLRVNIDATRVGNVARFINHSCDGGNLSTVLVRNSGALLPRLCFFAARDIAEGEELSFSYGDDRVRPEGLPCFCGSSCCLGTLPSEHT
ncbi:histone-lysine N-methyltransferase SUVR3 [Magnolia sinica]|uniref:histone-lysine N-methyltransferase SUVR3 n=1 Tax=Magnolia sinica TaxID=86752 RepID=UPI0026599A7E|nr:histone-lysine N-methyltransferase SUVR3 [Magnolia sinica]